MLCDSVTVNIQLKYFGIFTETYFDFEKKVRLNYTTVHIIFYNYLIFKRCNIFPDIRVNGTGMYDCDIRSY